MFSIAMAAEAHRVGHAPDLPNGAPAKEVPREPVADAAVPAEQDPGNLAPVLDEEILEPRGCIR